MGFGYNGTLVSLGERLEMLDFFSWMKKLQDKGVQEWTIWDASGYFIVNKLPAKKLIGLGSQPSASLILEALVEEQERPKRAEIKENCDLRSQYLQRLIQMTGVKAKYLNSWQVFREDSRYAEAVDVALEFVKRLEKDLPDLVEKIQPNNDNPASRLYLPLEIAEAFYLNYNFGIEGKYGPKTEQYFDEAIVKLAKEWRISYATIRSPLGPRKPGYLRDENVLVTGMSDREVKSLLNSDQEYRSWIDAITAIFRQDTETVTDGAMRMLRLLQGGDAA